MNDEKPVMGKNFDEMWIILSYKNEKSRDLRKKVNMLLYIKDQFTIPHVIDNFKKSLFGHLSHGPPSLKRFDKFLQ